jgi:hypothetical protein
MLLTNDRPCVRCQSSAPKTGLKLHSLGLDFVGPPVNGRSMPASARAGVGNQASGSATSLVMTPSASPIDSLLASGPRARGGRVVDPLRIGNHHWPVYP